MKQLASFVNGTWCRGSGNPAVLVNPATEEAVAGTSTEGLDFAAAVTHARERGGPALREMSFAGRAQLLRAMAKSIHTQREELIALAIENGGNTRSDAKFDIDGAAFTLAAYADLGESLGQATILPDGEGIQLGRTARLHGQHVLVPRTGVAVHINAFNFPAWGLAEKAAAALLAGVPVLSKPATATAVVAEHLVHGFVDQQLLPPGALSLICGSVGDLLSHLGGQDVLAFTGSSDTAARLRADPCVVERSVHVNIEADSLNAAVLGPDVSPGSDTWALFCADVVRDMIQKTGQKCTAIRRIFVPAGRVREVCDALSEALSAITVGNPAHDDVRMGPVATRTQWRDVRAGIARLAEETEPVFGGDGAVTPRHVPAGKGYFVGPVLRLCQQPHGAQVLHQHEVFGPVATLAPYDGTAAQAAVLIALGGGGLVASLYSDDRDWLRGAVHGAAPYQGRLYLGSKKIADQSSGPGTVIPHLLHGGPGRAGGGEELGGLRGMKLYQQRVALQGDKSLLAALL
jgi:oxepin-CoA hydrolase/3-oxo-5,6-dehydrosuberyl-CoA semialdehyde dehydrogenase